MDSQISEDENIIVLRLSCPDQPGIAALVLSFFSELGYNILESSQYEDPYSKTFFMRTVFAHPSNDNSALESIKQSFDKTVEHLSIQWEMRSKADKLRVLIAVSNWGHCLAKLLNTWHSGDLPVEIVGIVSNHESQREIADWYKIPYHYFPITKETKPQQEKQIMDLMKDTDAELLVLARYMQILSDEMCQQLKGNAINIHHSFLPGFKGAKPYHQAYERGVKLIGATAHYVNSDLDEGPIIEQAVERIAHANQPEELVVIGRDIETVVLNRAVKWHAEGRVLLNGKRTVVFRR
ncbi:formyltetrahydrofolate deformylase [Cocleimonas sp. KMM 6892]|uniref:formyltetrahydrofolate deformylase n=1 Tax=unclassified Cocleimonas TaxID=2639732 RepID=UPI002DB79EEC|nr:MULTISPECIES: formyltetrahydrofolate deformylase [unclassified Cocleimonas]MEB8433414.1 formyltetrahydrofolate deformylase [Cocleimonas sp. KMM 6892]MEC4716225.1 formyltetrahydrofolate deformylase [Cocleimonas sp. KMM 6895]MEC4745882.1 formyltetrahydrofolate deformylase [Cocleimonas sp. KMM 6896]